MINMDPTKNYNRWVTWIQPKTTMDEQHGPNQKLKWMSNMDQPKPTIDEQHGPNQKLQ